MPNIPIIAEGASMQGFCELEKVATIVLAWNHKEDTAEALKSILLSDYPDFDIILVDNNSTDGTLEMMTKDFPSVHVLSSGANLGVAGGYNLGIQYAMDQGYEFILIANNDITVHPEMLKELVRFASLDEKIGMVMPKIYHYYGDRTRLWCTGAHWRSFPPAVIMTNHGRLEQDVDTLPDRIDFAPSCVLLLKREMIEKVGYFDTEYFFFYDDWDYSKRVSLAGFSIGFVNTAILWHKVSVSTFKSEKPMVWWRRMGLSAAIYAKRYLSGGSGLFFMLWIGLREILTGNVKRGISIFKGWRDYNERRRCHNAA